MANHHLVILKKAYLDLILSGKKRIESRFSRTRRSYFGRVTVGDKIFFKVSSGPVCATAVVAEVKSFSDLTGEKIVEIKQRYNEQICGGSEYWQEKADCKYGSLVWLKEVKSIESVRISKKDWRAWVVLTDREDFGLLKKKA